MRAHRIAFEPIRRSPWTVDLANEAPPWSLGAESPYGPPQSLYKPSTAVRGHTSTPRLPAHHQVSLGKRLCSLCCIFHCERFRNFKDVWIFLLLIIFAVAFDGKNKVLKNILKIHAFCDCCIGFILNWLLIWLKILIN